MLVWQLVVLPSIALESAAPAVTSVVVVTSAAAVVQALPSVRPEPEPSVALVLVVVASALLLSLVYHHILEQQRPQYFDFRSPLLLRLPVEQPEAQYFDFRLRLLPSLRLKSNC
jgi:membrane protein implicated in regulation of membrane protease activity